MQCVGQKYFLLHLEVDNLSLSTATRDDGNTSKMWFLIIVFQLLSYAIYSKNHHYLNHTAQTLDNLGLLVRYRHIASTCKYFICINDLFTRGNEVNQHWVYDMSEQLPPHEISSVSTINALIPMAM